MDSFLLNNVKLNSDAALNSRLDSLKNLKAASSNKKELTESEKAEYAKAARGFESIFFSMMHKEMKKAMLDEENDKQEETMTFGADTLQDYASLMMSDQISRTGSGIGIAQLLYQHLTGGEKLMPAIVKNTENGK